jgi:hypothetical protein
MEWGAIERTISSVYFIPKFDTEPHLVVLIQPADDDRSIPTASVISRTVMRLLWQEHGVQLDAKAKEMFHVFSKNPSSSSTAGWIFEGHVHRLLEDGINVPLDPMVINENNRANAVNDSYVASRVGSDRWESQRMNYVPFTANDRMVKLEPSHYYVPVDPNSATYDSFAFEIIPTSGYDKPVLNSINMNPLTEDELGKIVSGNNFHVFGARCDAFSIQCTEFHRVLYSLSGYQSVRAWYECQGSQLCFDTCQEQWHGSNCNTIHCSHPSWT